MRKPRGRHRRYPYYKVQVLDPISVSWRDERKAFETLAGAQKYIVAKALTGLARVMLVESTGRRVVG